MKIVNVSVMLYNVKSMKGCVDMLRWRRSIIVQKPYQTVVKDKILDNLILESEMLVSSRVTEQKKTYMMYNQELQIAESKVKMLITIVSTLVGKHRYIQNYTASIPDGLAVLGALTLIDSGDGTTEATITGDVQLLNNKEYIQDFIRANEAEIIAKAADALLAKI